MAIPLKHLFPGPPAARESRSAEFIRTINMIVSLEQLLEQLCSHVRELYGAETVFILLSEPITGRYSGRIARGSQVASLPRFSFGRMEPLARWLNVNKTTLDIRSDTEVVRYLAPAEREILELNGIALVVPLIALNRLSGMLLLTTPAPGAPLGRDEREVLGRVVAQVAPAIEHALIAEQQENSLRKILHADKLATVGELAAGAAHEIRNPLTSIRSTVQYLRRDVPPEKRQYVDGILEEVDRIDGIIKGLLSLSRSSDLRIGSFDLASLLATVLTLLEPEFRAHGVEVFQELSGSPEVIEGDAGQLRQVFVNVLMNALQATPAGGSVSVRLTKPSTGLLAVNITDTGCGIPEADLAKVFNPFFTTKENGTGLGLSISYGIVTRHGGEIEVQSRCVDPDRGTTVAIRLPRTWGKQP